MKAYKKTEKKDFVPVILELETQEELDILYMIGMTAKSVPQVVSNVRDIEIMRVERVCNKIYNALKTHIK